MTASGILVVSELERGEPSPLSGEIIGLACQLCGGEAGTVMALVFGQTNEAAADTLIGLGADRVVAVEGAVVADYQAETWLPDLVAHIRKHLPAVVLMGHTAAGMDLAPRLAFRIGTAVAMGCEAITASDGGYLFTRACNGGKVRQVVSLTTAPAIATVRAKTQPAAVADGARTGEIIRIAPSAAAADSRCRVIERQRAETVGVRLEDAGIVVAGGGGLGGPEGFATIAELAEALGGALGASRVACDLGWCPPNYQIGLSGRTVAPDLYVAIGISGADQHMAGCANARILVAINPDPEAPIFEHSHYGIVGSYEEIVPALVRELRTRMV